MVFDKKKKLHDVSYFGNWYFGNWYFNNCIEKKKILCDKICINTCINIYPDEEKQDCKKECNALCMILMIKKCSDEAKIT
jgi:hypothetical protein